MLIIQHVVIAIIFNFLAMECQCLTLRESSWHNSVLSIAVLEQQQQLMTADSELKARGKRAEPIRGTQQSLIDLILGIIDTLQFGKRKTPGSVAIHDNAPHYAS